MPLALDPEHGAREPPLPFVGKAQVRDAQVALGALSLDQPDALRAADELGDGALRQLESLRELGHRGLLAPVGGAFDHQQEQVAAWREPVLPRTLLARP